MSEERKWRKGDVKGKWRRGDGMSEEVEDIDVWREVEEMGRQKKGSGGEEMGRQKKGSGGEEMGRQKKGSGGEKMGHQKKGSGGEKMGCQKKGSGGEEMGCQKKGNGGEVIRQEVEERRGDIRSLQAEEGRKFGFNTQSAMMVGSGWKQRQAQTCRTSGSVGMAAPQNRSRLQEMPDADANAFSSCCRWVIPNTKVRERHFHLKTLLRAQWIHVYLGPPHKGRRVAKSPENCSGHSEYTSTHAPPGLLVFNSPDTVAEPNKQSNCLYSAVCHPLTETMTRLTGSGSELCSCVSFHTSAEIMRFGGRGGGGGGRRVRSDPPLQFCNQTVHQRNPSDKPCGQTLSAQWQAEHHHTGSVTLVAQPVQVYNARTQVAAGTLVQRWPRHDSAVYDCAK